MTAPTRRAVFWLVTGLLFFAFIYSIRAILLPFVIGGLAAYFLDPAADRLQKWGLSRLMATSVITVVFFSVMIAAIVLLVPVVAGQLSDLIVAIPEYIQTLMDKYGQEFSSLLQRVENDQEGTVQNALQNFSTVAVGIITGVVASLFHSGIAIANLLSLLLITPIVAFYLLKEWDGIVIKIDALLPRQHAETVRMEVREIDRTLAGFVRGQLMVCLLLAIYYGVGLSLAGLNFGLVIGLLTGALVIIPYLGFGFGFVIGMAVAVLQFSDWHDIAVVLAVFLTGQIIEGYFITPKLVGSKVGLHPVWLIFGMLAGGALFGFVGIFIAVPVTAIIGVLIRFALSRYLQSDVYRGDYIPPPIKRV